MDFDAMVSRSGLTADQFASAVERAKRSTVAVIERILVVEHGRTQLIQIERRGVGPLLTIAGPFEHYDFEVKDVWGKYSAIVLAPSYENFQPLFDLNCSLVVRIDSGCETGQLFGDWTCECKQQMDLALRLIAENGQGILINIPRQDGRGLGLSHKLATLRLQQELGVTTTEASELVEARGSRDERTYAGAVAVLKFLGVHDRAVALATNNEKKHAIFTENGYEISEVSVVIPATPFTKHHLLAKQQDLGHRGLVIEDGEQQDIPFLDRLARSVAKANSLVCCGLDPILGEMPNAIRTKSAQVAALVFLKRAVRATWQYVCAYKIQKAFFDLLPDGQAALCEVIETIRSYDRVVPIIIDAKVGDIANTMAAYLEYYFSRLNVDGLVVNPYMGSDVLEPFSRHPGKAAIVLAKTSNASGSVVQDQRLESGQPVWGLICDQVTAAWNSGMAVVPVLASTANLPFDAIAKRLPERMPVLLAGVGAQGGDWTAISRLRQPVDRTVLVNSSRAILYSVDKDADGWENAIAERVKALRLQLNMAAATGQSYA